MERERRATGAKDMREPNHRQEKGQLLCPLMGNHLWLFQAVTFKDENVNKKKTFGCSWRELMMQTTMVVI